MCIVDNKIPVIHTLESDMQQFSNNNEASPVMAAQQQLDQRLIPAVDDTSTSKWKVLFRIMLIVLVLIVAAFVAYKLTTSGADKNTSSNKNNTDANTQNQVPKTYTVSDVWPGMVTELSSSTGEATSTNAFVVITITDFKTTYDAVTNNEDRVSELAQEYFGIAELSKFTTQPINNIELHVADGGSKIMVYGYVGEKYLLFTDSIANWMTIHDKLSANVNKNS
mgnify:CR=1 FL=1